MGDRAKTAYVTWRSKRKPWMRARLPTWDDLSPEARSEWDAAAQLMTRDGA